MIILLYGANGLPLGSHRAEVPLAACVRVRTKRATVVGIGGVKVGALPLSTLCVRVIARGRPSVVAARLVVDACAAARLLFVYLGSVSNFVRVRVAEWCGWRFGSTCTQINETRIVLIVQNACLKVGCAAGHGPRHVGPLQVQVLQGITVVAVGGAWRGGVEGERRRERRG